MNCRLLHDGRRAAALRRSLCGALLPRSAAAVSDHVARRAESRGGPERPGCVLALVAGVPARRIALAAPARRSRAAEGVQRRRRAPVRGRQGASHWRSVSAVTFRRRRASIALSDLAWTADAGRQPDRAHRNRIAGCRGAAGRARAAGPHAADVSVRFAGIGADAAVFGDYPATQIADGTARSGLFWSPVLDGDTATIEFHATRAYDSPARRCAFRAYRTPLAGGAPARACRRCQGHRQRSGACKIDIACVTPQSQAVLNLAKASAKMTFVDDDGRTLPVHRHAAQRFGAVVHAVSLHRQSLPHIGGHRTHAQHVSGFSTRVSCNSKAMPPYVQLTGGATLLGRSPDRDWSHRAAARHAARRRAVRRVARGSRRNRHDRCCHHPSSGRRPQEVEPRQRSPPTRSRTMALRATATSPRSCGTRGHRSPGRAAARC